MSYGENTTPEIEQAAAVIVDAALKVHREFGPGLLECVYETCLARELIKRKHKVLRQLRVPIFYDGEELDADLRLDLLIDDRVIVEVKAVEKLIPLFEAQVLTYLKFA